MVTVIIPAYNAEKTLERCLNSVVNQTYQDLEILVINDGSTDRTEEIIENFSDRYYSIVSFNRYNGGVSAARNLGIQKASGEWLLFVDADDYLEPDMIERMSNVCEEDLENDLVICGYDEVYTDHVNPQSMNGKEELDRLELLRALFAPDSVRGYLFNKMFRTDIIRKYHILLDEEIFICEDLLFCCEYGQQIRKAVVMKDALYHYVINVGSAVHGGYSARRFTSVYAFDKMSAWMTKFNDRELEQVVNAHYIVICIQLFFKLLRNKKDFSSTEMKKLMTVIRSMDFSFLNSNWSIKYRLAYLPLKLVSSFRGDKL